VLAKRPNLTVTTSGARRRGRSAAPPLPQGAKAKQRTRSSSFPGRWRLIIRRRPFVHASEKLVMKIRPLQDRVVVRRVKEEEKTKGGLYIPDSAKEKPVEATVIAVGNGKVLEDGTVRKLDVKEGDRILFGKYSGSEVKIDGEEHLILREDDILGVIES
jgi:chaperonin GroES